MKAGDLEKAADLAVQNPYYNPRPVTRDGIRALLADAFEGRRPKNQAGTISEGRGRGA
jgi:maleylacetate reductase